MNCGLSSLVEAYISYKRCLGFQITSEAVYLRSFARFTEESGYTGPFTREIAFQWCESGNNPSIITKGRRFESLKGFADYVNSVDRESEHLPKLPYGNPHQRVTPHIYTLDETCLLMERCSDLFSPDGIRSLTIKTAIGLLWSTGMRTSEVVNLTLPDIDFENDLLMIRSSKFNRDRVIPVSPDVTSHLRAYREEIETLSENCKETSHFFLTTGGKPLKRNSFEYAFQKIRDAIDVRDSGYEHARLYDFRHSFATRTIRTWLINGEDVNAKLFLLSTYLGHSHPEDTYWYISSTPELLELASEKYEELFGGGANE